MFKKKITELEAIIKKQLLSKNKAVSFGKGFWVF